MQSTSRWFTNVFIILLLCILLIEGLPTWHWRHSRLRESLVPLSRRLGIEQNGWQLYAPEPDYWNLRISAEVSYPDGTVKHWNSPNWSAVSSLRKIPMARHINYYEYLADDESSMYWPQFADYLRRSMPRSSDGRAPARIALTRHWAEIPAPVAGTNWQPVPEEIPFTWNEEFFVKEYR